MQNAYFPLFIPLGNFVREAAHVEGFAKEMAVVTHHRLIADGKGGLIPDPEAKFEEPLVVRPTSETIIGDAMSRWVQSWRDLPLLLNQWANVVRWEMRTRMFLRTSEFLWQEGHTAHESREDAMAETMRALEMYRAFAEEDVALPVIAGEKPANERFPGAVGTWSIEAMMQDGKALQAGTSHYLGTSFAEAASIRFQGREGGQQLAHTTSWGVSTRMVGAMIMTHGDDDGLRVPPTLAPFQVVILPMLREDEGDAAILDYCQGLRSALLGQSAFGEPVRVLLDGKPGKAAAKRWDWVRKGAPLIVEVGPRDMENGKVAVLRRDRLWNEAAKPGFAFTAKDEFAGKASTLLEDIQQIEVISGPGGTLYGPNAVNGVINVTTKDAQETLGTLVRGTAGPLEGTAAIRHGFTLGDSGAVRVYANWHDAEGLPTGIGDPARDAYRGWQAGFRSDFVTDSDHFTLQGDIFRNNAETLPGDGA